MEGFVCLEKTEKLETFEHGSINLKEFVLKDIEPFPGYYFETPKEYDTLKQKYVFAAIKQGKGCYEDEVLRAFYSFRDKVDFEFEANYGRFLIFNKFRPCIRIKVTDFDVVPEIIEQFKNAGIQFDPAEKFPPTDTHIKVRKYNTFVEINTDIYSGDDPDHYYIKVPYHHKWDDFVKLIFDIRNSGNFGVFDAAQTSLYQKNGIIEFIRIYTKSLKPEDFIRLKDEILKRI